MLDQLTGTFTRGKATAVAQRALPEASDRLMGILVKASTARAWQAVADEFSKLLNGVHTVLFLVPIRNPSSLVIKAVSGGPKLSEPPATLKAEINQHATEGQIERWSERAQEWSEYTGQSTAEVLQINLRDRRGHLLSVLIASHPAGRHFGPDELITVADLAARAGVPLDLLRIFKLLRHARHSIHRAVEPGGMLVATLRAAEAIIRPGRAWLAIPDGSSGITYRHRNGQDTLVPLPEPPPTPTLTAAMLQESAEALRDPTRARRPDGSGMYAPIVWEGRTDPVAILAMTPLPGKTFDEQDWDLLCCVAKHAASDSNLAARSFLPTESPTAWTDYARSLVEDIRKALEFEGGLVYLAVPRTRVLHGFAGSGTPEARDVSYNQPWVFPIKPESDQPHSAAAFAYSSLDGKAWPDPHNSNGEVNLEGLEKFKIRGSLVAVPLAVRTGDDEPDRFGSLVFWANRVYGAHEQAELDRLRLLAFSRAEAAARQLRHAMFTKTRDQREALQREMARVMRQMLIETDLEKNLGAVLEAIARLSFPRVRLYKFKYSNSFVGFASVGMADACPDPDDFGKIRLLAVEGDVAPVNYYAKQMYDGVCAARLAAADVTRKPAGKGMPNGLLAQVHYPAPDRPLAPECARLGKDSRKPWAEVPIVLGGKLYGLIAADFHGTGREIRDDDLEVLDTFAGLAAQAYQIHEKRGVLTNPEELYAQVGPDQDEELVYRRILLYACHGEDGLGFSRAAFYSAVSDAPDTFELRQAVGSQTKETFLDIGKLVYQRSLGEILLDAKPDKHDLDLNDTLRKRGSITLPPGGLPSIPLVVRRGEGSEWNFLCDGFDSPVVLVAPVRFAPAFRGLIVVDRAWQHQWEGIGVGPDDEQNLATFARHTGEILTRYKWARRQGSYVESLYSKIGHELTEPMDLLRGAIYRAKRVGPPATRSRGIPARSDGEIDAALAELYSTFKGILLCGDLSKQTLVRVSGGDVSYVARDEAGKRVPSACNFGYRIAAGAESVHLSANIDSLRLAVRELLRNAVSHLPVSVQPEKAVDREIVVEVNWPIRYDGHTSAIEGGDHLEIAVWNSGQPISDESRRQCDRGESVRSSKGPDRYGIGLLLVRHIAEVHSGRFFFDPKRTDGTRAVLSIPITSPRGGIT